jgi:hypothetical protein
VAGFGRELVSARGNTGRTGTAVAVVAVGLAIAFVVGGCNLVPPQGSPTPSLPTPSVATPAATPSPPVQTLSPTPTATGDAQLESLWALISDPNLSYHLSGSGVNKNNGVVFERFTLELDISGDDYDGQVNSIGSSGKAHLIRKDGVMYARPAGSLWAARRVTNSVIQFVPFLDIHEMGDLQADGVQQSGRQTLYVYVSTSEYRPDVAHMMDLSRFATTCQTMQLQLLITDAAVPVSAHFECRVGSDTYAGTSDYKFTEFGKKFSIKPPIKPPN